MLIYWLMFAFPAVLSLLESRRGFAAAAGHTDPADNAQRGRFAFAWAFVGVALVVIIGFRWETGGDWFNYDRIVQGILGDGEKFSLFGEPGFRLIALVAAHSRYGMLVVTLASGLILGCALVRFCLAQPRPWLCLLVSMPYFVVVLGMGYIRQGMAVSCMMLAMVALGQGGTVRVMLWILLGGMFHSTALVLMPLAVFGARASLVLRGMIVALTLAGLVFLISSERIGLLLTNYVDQEMTSSGAVIRMFMTAVPAAIFLRWRDRFGLAGAERLAWSMLSLAAIAGCMMILILPSSTAIDRMGLYLLPVQCFVCSRLPDALGGNERTARVLVSAIIALYAAAFFVWLNYADNVYFWLPYRFFFFEDGVCLEC